MRHHRYARPPSVAPPTADRRTAYRVERRFRRFAVRIERVTVADRFAYWRARWMR